MAIRKGLMGGVALVAVGAAGAFSISHVKLSWSPQAQAAPPVVMAEAKPALPPPSKEQVSEARMLSRTFSQVASQLSPSVVRISVAKTVKGMRGAHHDPGMTYSRSHCCVAVRITSKGSHFEAEAELIQRLRPRDNLVAHPDGGADDTPF